MKLKYVINLFKRIHILFLCNDEPVYTLSDRTGQAFSSCSGDHTDLWRACGTVKVALIVGIAL